jgi:hypothetical protein
MEFKEANRFEGVGQDMIVEVAPVVSCPGPADGNIATNVEENDGVYRPSRRTWSAPTTALSDRARIRKPSIVAMSAAWRPCDGLAMSSGSMPTTARSPTTLSNAGRAMILAQGGRIRTLFAPFCRELAASGSVKRLGSTNFADMMSGGQMRDVVLEPVAVKSLAAGASHRAVRPLRRQQFATLP